MTRKHEMHILLGCCLTTGLLAVSAAAYAQNNATVREVNMTMKTYQFSDPDPVAAPSSSIYPYFRFDGYEAEGTDREWTMVEMENDYIKVTIAPEIGGKVWGAIEKSTRNPFIYYNHVVKFRDISMRGPWTSGGVEFNFGLIGHVPTTATPVDYVLRENEDGSASCFVGALELMTGTRWTVEINLPKDKAYFTTQASWENSSGLGQPFYSWSNAAYHEGKDMEMIFPGSAYIGHGGDAHPYPKDAEGRDLSWYRNNAFGGSKSYHVLGSYADFYGAYLHDRDYGSAHYVPYEEKLGRKIFIWGLSESGMIWKDLLTDDDGQYVELQSGRLFNQPGTASARTPFKHPQFAPYGSETWKEYWAPVKGTGGITKMNPLGTLHLSREGEKLTVSFCPLQRVQEPIEIRSAGKTVYSGILDLDVLETWSVEQDLPAAELEDLSVEIGAHRLVYDPRTDGTPVERPLTLPDDFDWNSVYGLYVQGEQWLNQKQLDKAADCLARSLEKDPDFLPSLRCMGLLCLRRGDNEEALSYCKRALRLDTYDGSSNYLYATAQFRLGKMLDAKEGFSLACCSAADRGAALIGLGQCCFLEGNFEKAESCWRESLSCDSRKVFPKDLLICLYRITGQTKKAEIEIDAVLDRHPLDHFAAFEKYLLSHSDRDKSAFQQTIQNELPHENYLEIAEHYATLQRWNDVEEVLGLAPDHPLIEYHRAYCLHRLGQEAPAARHLEIAEAASPAFVFPHRLQTLTCLEWASTQHPSWKNKYYSALLKASLGKRQEAVALLDACGEADFAPLFVVRARMKQGEDRLRDLLAAEKLAPADRRIGMELIAHYQRNGRLEQALAVAERHYRRDPGNDKIGLRYAKLLSADGAYDKSLSILSRLVVLPYEGAYEGRAVYREANLMKSIDCVKKRRYRAALDYVEKARQWPKNLGVGKPYDADIDFQVENYLQGIILDKIGRSRQAEAFFESVAARTLRSAHSDRLLRALALRRLGRQPEADRLMDEWTAGGADDAVLTWCKAYYRHGKAGTEALGNGPAGSPDETAKPWEAAARQDGNFPFVRAMEDLL